ncbi:MAG: hypothetical protein ACOYOJ_05400 [Alsobacter sp.]
MRRLVEPQQARACHQRAADGGHLLLAARQGSGKLVAAPSGAVAEPVERIAEEVAMAEQVRRGGAGS